VAHLTVWPPIESLPVELYEIRPIRMQVETNRPKDEVSKMQYALQYRWIFLQFRETRVTYPDSLSSRFL
jgi:hypothetical protein